MTQSFPEEMELIIVDELFKHYTLGFERSESQVHIICERCDELIGSITRESIRQSEAMELYEQVIELHREYGVE